MNATRRRPHLAASDTRDRLRDYAARARKLDLAAREADAAVSRLRKELKRARQAYQQAKQIAHPPPPGQSTAQPDRPGSARRSATTVPRSLAGAVRQWTESCDPDADRILAELASHLGMSQQDFRVACQLADAVAEQRVRFEKMCARCQRGFSPDSVHDTRVHCRRLIARVTLVRQAMRDTALDSVLRTLKRFLKPLGELRDVQVQKQILMDELARFPELGGLWVDLSRREAKLRRAAKEWVGGLDRTKLARRLKRLEAELINPAARLASKAGLHQSVVRALEHAYRVVVDRRQQIDPAVPATLHRVRIAYKKFRYMVESLPPAVGQASSLQLSAMAHYQTALGNIQDAEVSRQFVSDYLARFPVQAEATALFLDHLNERRDQLVRAYIELADTLASFWPQPLPLPSATDAAPPSP
jgi:CHAD domain-containing protein